MKIVPTILAWLVVVLPLRWGIVKSFQKSLPLFQAAPPAASAKS